MCFIFQWARSGSCIPDHIATGTPGSESGFIDPLDALLQISLENTVQLKSLPSCNPERSVAQIPGDSIMREVLLGS
jgi:hypothetical protein